TTWAVDDTAAIVAALQARFPTMQAPHTEELWYATPNRQVAVEASAKQARALLVIGGPKSSNSSRLVEVRAVHGCVKAISLERASEIDWNCLEGVERLGLTAGVPAPQILVDEVIEAARSRFEVTVEEVAITQESVVFNIPRVLR